MAAWARPRRISHVTQVDAAAFDAIEHDRSAPYSESNSAPERQPASPARSRTRTDQGRIIITGTGRAGTTLLVQIFTALGFDTGYTLAESLADVDAISTAGLEKVGAGPALPYVAKSPLYIDTLPDLLKAGTLPVHAAIVPMRNLTAAADSRRRVHFEAQRRGIDTAMQPGGLWHTTQPEIQEYILATQFYLLVHALVQHDVPLYLFEFPRFAQDVDYLFDSLGGLFAEHGVSRRELRGACEAVVDLGKITIP